MNIFIMFCIWWTVSQLVILAALGLALMFGSLPFREPPERDEFDEYTESNPEVRFRKAGEP